MYVLMMGQSGEDPWVGMGSMGDWGRSDGKIIFLFKNIIK
jgi:hypothetical protein